MTLRLASHDQGNNIQNATDLVQRRLWLSEPQQLVSYKQKLFRDIKSGTSEADGMGLNLGSLSGVHKIRFQSLSSYLSMLRVQVL